MTYWDCFCAHKIDKTQFKSSHSIPDESDRNHIPHPGFNLVPKYTLFLKSLLFISSLVSLNNPRYNGTVNHDRGGTTNTKITEAIDMAWWIVEWNDKFYWLLARLIRNHLSCTLSLNTFKLLEFTSVQRKLPFTGLSPSWVLLYEYISHLALPGLNLWYTGPYQATVHDLYFYQSFCKDLARPRFWPMNKRVAILFVNTKIDVSFGFLITWLLVRTTSSQLHTSTAA